MNAEPIAEMRIRITRQPGGLVHGINLDLYRCGDVYDVSPVLAEYLVVEGYAAFEMRDPDKNSSVEVERRRPVPRPGDRSGR